MKKSIELQVDLLMSAEIPPQNPMLPEAQKILSEIMKDAINKHPEWKIKIKQIKDKME